MRTITNTFNVYSFKELSEEAKEKAIENFRLVIDFPYCEEAINSIKEISKAMNCDAEYYSYDGICYSVEFTSKEYEDIETICARWDKYKKTSELDWYLPKSPNFYTGVDHG